MPRTSVTSIPVPLGLQLRAALALPDGPGPVEAGHWFLSQDGEPGWLARAAALHRGYRPEQAEAAWRRIFEFLDEHVRHAPAMKAAQ